jgi:hypothetical protein
VKRMHTSRRGGLSTLVRCAMGFSCALLGPEALGQDRTNRGALSVRLEVDRTFPLTVTAVRGVRELSDGSVLALVREPRTIVIFDSTGRSQRSIGRQGDGPGEYRGPKAIFALGGDSSLVVDGTNRKWYLLDRDKFATLRPSSDAWQPVLSSGVDARGTLLQMVGLFSSDNPRQTWLADPLPQFSKRIALVLRTLDGKTQIIDTVTGQFFGSIDGRITMNGRSVYYFGIVNPLQTHDQAVMFASGEIAIAHFSPYRVDWRARDGVVRRGPPVGEPVVAVTPAIKRRFADDWKRNDDGTPMLGLDGFPPWPAVVPPFLDDALVAGADGLLYVTRTRSATTEKLVVDVFDKSGTRTGTAILPAGCRLLAVTSRGWYVAQRNEDDEETLVRYRRVK